MIAITIDDPLVSAGGMVKATVRWRSDGERDARRIIVAAEWQIEGEGDRCRGVGRSTQVALSKNSREATVPVRLLIPYDGPVTYEGQHFKIVWNLHVRVDQFGFDEFAEAPFRVELRRRRAAASR